MVLFEHHAFDDHEQVAFINDRKTGLQAIIAVHNTHLGPALGGCRMWPYHSSAEALNDVLRLSKGMTYKSALAKLPLGGGKSVIIGNPRNIKSKELMLKMGEFVNSFDGSYIVAEDSGISVEDIQHMEQRTKFVGGTHAYYHYNNEAANGNPAPSTAYGVFVGLQAAVKFKLKSDLQGVTVAIQGLGHVGYRLAEHLYKAGAKLIVTDIYPDNLEKAQSKFAATIVSPDEIYNVQADVFSPCALGAIIDDASLAQLKVAVVAGAANNQLAEERHGLVLLDKGILYAPDYVINAGGVIDIYHQTLTDSSAAKMRQHIENIGDTLGSIFTRADVEQLPTNIVANTMAEEIFKPN
ncbi:Glu/Leu/Phe/Val dehydrogenase dimerization domain-containing protein [Alteromonadaceae bacterium BrNp21-10]|nr:Glu/Leu/Phe/Val dehydrogenase dimerization domain-containing protein [Alteromonadaceae bacterium BrNp21-10]